MSAKREGMARSWEVATRELPNFWERTQGKSWAEKVGQNKKLGREGEPTFVLYESWSHTGEEEGLRRYVGLDRRDDERAIRRRRDG